MTDDTNVVPIKRPTPLPAGIDVFVSLLCDQLEDMPAELQRHGLTAAEADELKTKTNVLVAAYRVHVPPENKRDS